MNNIVILLGGRAAEELVLKDFTTGAGNDIERATALARKMVCEWGMSEAMGPLSYGKKEEQIFLGREFATHKDYSEETAQKIDKEVARIVMTSYESAKQILSDRMDILNKIATELLEKEVLNAAGTRCAHRDHAGAGRRKSDAGDISLRRTAKPCWGMIGSSQPEWTEKTCR